MFRRWRAQRAGIPLLTEYWDDLVTGIDVRNSQQVLDASLTATVFVTHEAYNERAADPAFAARLLKELTGSFQVALAQQLEPMPVTLPGSPANGRTRIALPAPPVEPRPLARRRLALAAVCTLFILAGLVGGYLAFNPGDDGEPPSIPAVIDGSPVATPIATPVPELSSETLLEFYFAAGEFAASDEDFFIWNRYSLAPGNTLRYPNKCGAPKITLAYVESGEFAIRAEGSLEVTRDGDTDTIPTGTEVSLLAGDSFLYLNETGDKFLGFRNPGPEPLVVTEAIWRLNECVEGPPVTSAIIWDSYDYEPAIDPSRPVVVSLRRLTALAGVSLSEMGPAGVGWMSSDVRVLERVYVEAGTLEVNKSVPNDSGTPSAQQTYRYPEGRSGTGGTFTLDLDMDPTGTTYLLNNIGGDPLVITVFSVAYEDIGLAGATPSPAET